MTQPDPLRTFLEQGMTPEEAASAVLADRRLRDYVHTIVLYRARYMARGIVWEHEDAEHEALVSGDLAERTSARRTLISDSFWSPLSGDWIAWLDGTEEDHLARAAWCRQRASAHLADAERHEAAARDIAVAGVKTLRELEALVSSR